MRKEKNVGYPSSHIYEICPMCGSKIKQTQDCCSLDWSGHACVIEAVHDEWEACYKIVASFQEQYWLESEYSCRSLIEDILTAIRSREIRNLTLKRQDWADTALVECLKDADDIPGYWILDGVEARCRWLIDQVKKSLAKKE